MIALGWSTALQPTSALSPRRAPTFRRPVSNVPVGTRTFTAFWSSRRLESTAAPPRCAPLPRIEYVDVRLVRHLRAVHQQRVLELGVVADGALRAHDYVAAELAAGEELRLGVDSDRADERGVARELRGGVDEDRALGVDAG